MLQIDSQIVSGTVSRWQQGAQMSNQQQQLAVPLELMARLKQVELQFTHIRNIVIS